MTSKSRIAFIMTLLALFATPCVRLSAFTQKAVQPYAGVVTLEPKKDNNQLLIERGKKLNLVGEVEGESLNGETYYLRIADRIIDSGRFSDKWRLTLDTSSISRSYVRIGIYHRNKNNIDTLVTFTSVTVLETAPFEWNLPSEKKRIEDNWSIKIDSTNKYKIKSVSFYWDKKAKEIRNVNEAYLLEPDSDMLGSHQLGGLVHTDDGWIYELPNLDLDVVGKAEVLPFKFGNTVDIAKINGGIRLRMRIAPSIGTIRKVVYKVNGGFLGERTATPFDLFFWEPKDTFLGLNDISAEVIDQGEHTYKTRNMRVNVLSTSIRNLVKKPPLSVHLSNPLAQELPTDVTRCSCSCYQ